MPQAKRRDIAARFASLAPRLLDLESGRYQLSTPQLGICERLATVAQTPASPTHHSFASLTYLNGAQNLLGLHGSSPFAFGPHSSTKW